MAALETWGLTREITDEIRKSYWIQGETGPAPVQRGSQAPQLLVDLVSFSAARNKDF